MAINLKADKLFFVMEDEPLNNTSYKVSAEIPLAENGDIPAMNIEELDLFIKNNRSKKTASETEAYSHKKVISVLEKAREACKNGVSRVHLVDGRQDGVLLTEIFSALGSGTMIYTSDYGKIRAMEQTDIPAVLAVMRPFVESGKLLPRTQKQLEERLEDFVVYELDGGIHACASLHDYGNGQAEIAAIAVEQKFDNMGIGPKLIDFLLKKGKALKAKSIFILTTQAADWFEKQGFSPDSIESLPEERRKIWTPERNSRVYRLSL